MRIETEGGIVGWGDGAAWITPQQIEALRPILIGVSPWDFETVRTRLENVNYYRQTPLMNAMVEMAMLDAAARSVDLPVWAILGGRLVDEVEAAAYLFYEHHEDGSPYDVDERAGAVLDRFEADRDYFGYQTVKLKGGVYHPSLDLEVLTELSRRGARPLRLDPQGAWTLSTALNFARTAAHQGLDLEYLEDPCEGIPAMAEMRSRSPYPLATNMCVTSWKEFGAAVQQRPVDIILADIWYWGGVGQTRMLDRAARAAGFSVGMHSGLELGVGLAAMVHVSATMSQLKGGIDTMNQLMVDDILTERLEPRNGAIPVPSGPGWGVEVDEARLRKWSDFARSPEAQDRYLNPHLPDPARPGWFPVHPQW